MTKLKLSYLIIGSAIIIGSIAILGVLDTLVTVPLSLNIEQEEIQIKPGEQKEIWVKVMPQTNQKHEVILSGNTNFELFEITPKLEPTTISDQISQIPVTISVNEKTPAGYYKILLSTQLPDVMISTYATIKVV